MVDSLLEGSYSNSKVTILDVISVGNDCEEVPVVIGAGGVMCWVIGAGGVNCCVIGAGLVIC